MLFPPVQVCASNTRDVKAIQQLVGVARLMDRQYSLYHESSLRTMVFAAFAKRCPAWDAC